MNVNVTAVVMSQSRDILMKEIREAYGPSITMRVEQVLSCIDCGKHIHWIAPEDMPRHSVRCDCPHIKFLVLYLNENPILK